jgi:hypothetical protein
VGPFLASRKEVGDITDDRPSKAKKKKHNNEEKLIEKKK